MKARQKDIRAIAELSWGLLQRYFKRYQEPPFPTIKIQERKRGIYYRLFSTVLLPKWIFKEHEAFVIYYVTHELIHAFVSEHGHTPKFKEAEAAVLKEWGIDIRYARAYPRSLSYHGVELYRKPPARPKLRTARRPWDCSGCKLWIDPGDDYYHKGDKRYCMNCVEKFLP